MTWFEKFKSMDEEELASWLDKHGQFDSSPWIQWFDELYCNKCEAVPCTYKDEYWGKREIQCSWCELEHKCKHFSDMDHAPDNKDIIKMFLQTEVE